MKGLRPVLGKGNQMKVWGGGGDGEAARGGGGGANGAGAADESLRRLLYDSLMSYLHIEGNFCARMNNLCLSRPPKDEGLPLLILYPLCFQVPTNLSTCQESSSVRLC